MNDLSEHPAHWPGDIARFIGLGFEKLEKKVDCYLRSPTLTIIDLSK